MKKQISLKVVSLVFSILVICFVIGFYAFADWREPTQPQPGGNVDAPINVGLIDQVKKGSLGVFGAFRAVGGADPAIEPGLVVNNGNVGIGTASPQAKLHIGGTADIDGIMFPDGTLQTTAAGFGDRVSIDTSGNDLAKNNIYQAQTDGFFLVTAAGGADIRVLAGSTNPPTNIIGRHTWSSSTTFGSISVPIRRNEYVRVTGTMIIGSPDIWWQPMGAGGLVKK